MIGIIFCFLFILLLEVIFPFWWWIMAVPFFYSLARVRSGWEGFRVGMLSAGLLWLLSCVYMYFTGSEIITARVARMFNLGNPLFMIILTTLIAAVAAGISGVSGYTIKALFRH